ncbi:MAG: rhomboid family intramembrane serine protease [Syntrophomonadaceae bacterium]|nr:rhomboid family intramembrane serine protease [Syntrophomonadaceae bacterium]
MIPLKDTPKTRIFPYVNISLILFNIFVFAFQLMLTERGLMLFAHTYGLVPIQVDASLAGLMPFITYQFLHGGWLHIGSNMLYLWVFGDNIEDRLGHVKYLVFYLLAGTLAGLAQVLADPASQTPIIGASGAVAGVLGAYLISCPRARVIALVPIFFLFTIAEVPAIIFLGLWFVLQVFSGVASIGMNITVAWWAHIGGFIAGLALVGLFGKRIKCQ